MKSFKNYLTELRANHHQNDDDRIEDFYTKLGPRLYETPYAHSDTHGSFAFPSMGHAIQSLHSSMAYASVMSGAPPHMANVKEVGKKLESSAVNFYNTIKPHLNSVLTQVKSEHSATHPIQSMSNNEIINDLMIAHGHASQEYLRQNAHISEIAGGSPEDGDVQQHVITHVLRNSRAIGTALEKHPHQFIFNGAGDSLTHPDTTPTAKFTPNIPRPQDPTPPNNN
jgi:hypothetical protein